MDCEQKQLCAEYAKSGRSKCKHCRKEIDKETLRIGKLEAVCLAIFLLFHSISFIFGLGDYRQLTRICPALYSIGHTRASHVTRAV